MRFRYGLLGAARIFLLLGMLYAGLHVIDVLAVSHSFVQTSWSGGADATAAGYAVHPNNKAGWTKYDSIGGVLDVSVPDTLKLITNIGSQTVTDAGATPGGPNGATVKVGEEVMNDPQVAGQTVSNFSNTTVDDFDAASISLTGTVSQEDTTASDSSFSAVVGSTYPNQNHIDTAISPNSWSAVQPANQSGSGSHILNQTIVGNTPVIGTVNTSGVTSISASGYSPTINYDALVSVGTIYSYPGTGPGADDKAWCPKSGEYNFCQVTSVTGGGPIDLSNSGSRTLTIYYLWCKAATCSSGINSYRTQVAYNTAGNYPPTVNYSQSFSFTTSQFNCSTGTLLSASGTANTSGGFVSSKSVTINSISGCTISYTVSIVGQPTITLSSVTFSLTFKPNVVPNSGSASGSYATPTGWGAGDGAYIISYYASCSGSYTTCSASGAVLTGNTITYTYSWYTASLSGMSMNAVTFTLGKAGVQPYDVTVTRSLSVPAPYENATVNSSAITYVGGSPPAGASATVSNAQIVGTTLSYSLRQYNPTLTNMQVQSITFSITRTTVTPATNVIGPYTASTNSSFEIKGSQIVLSQASIDAGGVTAATPASCAPNVPCAAFASAPSISGGVITYSIQLYNPTDDPLTITKVSFTVGPPGGFVATKTVGPYSITVPSGYTYKSAVFNYTSQPAGAVATFASGPTVSGTTMTYSVLLSNPSTSALTLSSIDFTVGQPPGTTATKVVGPFTVTVPAGSSVQGTPTIAYSAKPTGASATISTGPTITGTSLVYSLTLSNPTTDDLTVQSVTFDLRVTPPISGTMNFSKYNLNDDDVLPYQLVWTETSDANTRVKVQIRTALDAGGAPGTWSTFAGPGGDGGSYFSKNEVAYCATSGSGTITVTCSIPQGVGQLAGTGTRWVQMRAVLDSDSSDKTPQLADMRMDYAINVAPTISSVTVTPGAAGYYVIAYNSSDPEESTGTVTMFYNFGVTLSSSLTQSDSSISVGGNYALLPSANGTIQIEKEVIQYTARTGSTLTGVTRAALGSRATSHVAGTSQYVWIRANTVSGATGSQSFGSSKSISWNAAADVPSYYSGAARLRISINDGNVANQVGNGDSANFIFDTKAPVPGAPPITIGTGQTKVTEVAQTLYVNASDDSPLEMIISNNGEFAGASYVPYNSSNNIALPDSDAVYTYYVKFRDSFGNVSGPYSATVILDRTAPEVPTDIVLQEVSNEQTGDVIFVYSWRPVASYDASGSEDFDKYEIYRSTNGGTATLAATLTGAQNNAYINTVCNTTCVGNTYAYSIKSIDNIGNASEASVPISAAATGLAADTTAPTISGISVGQSGINYVPVTWSATEDARFGISYLPAPLDPDADFSTAPSILSPAIVQSGTAASTYVVGLLPSSAYGFQAFAVDLAGNTGTLIGQSTFTFPQKDSSPPQIQGVATKAGQKTAHLAFTTNELAQITVDYGGKKYGSPVFRKDHNIALPFDLTGSSMSYTIYAKDAAANIGVQSGAVTLEGAGAGAVALSGAPTVSTTAYSATVNFATSRDAIAFVELGKYADGNGNPIYDIDFDSEYFGSTHTFQLSDLTPGTTYYYRILLIDGSGNAVTALQDSFDTSASVSSDTLDPALSGNVTQTTASAFASAISFSTTELTTATIQLSTDGKAFSDTYAIPGFRTNHFITLENLSPATMYHYRIKLTDTSGNIATIDNNGGNYQFATLPYAGSIPEISNVGVTTGDTSVTIKWNTSIPTYGTIDFGLRGVMSHSVSDGLLGTSHEITLPNNLIPNTAYGFAVRAVTSDEQMEVVRNQPSVFIAPASGITAALADTENPVLELVTLELVTNDSAVLSWRTSEPTISTIDYGLTNAYGLTATSSAGEMTTTHAITLRNLSALTKYFYRLVFTDGAGNRVSADMHDNDILNFTTTEQTVEKHEVDEGDNTPPDILNVEVSDIKSRSAKITWTTNEDSVSVVEYGVNSRVYDESEGSTVNFTDDHEVVLTDLKQGTQYFFVVVGLDRSGNRGTSIEYSFTTLETTTEDEIFEELQKQLEEESAKQQLELLNSFNELSSSTQSIVKTFLDGLKTVDEEERERALKVIFGEFTGPPRILGSKPNVTVTDSSAIIEWETLTEISSIVAYASEAEFDPKSSTPYTKEAGKKNEYVTQHKVTLTELRPFTTYNFQISGEEKSGRKAVGVNRTFKTLPIQPKFEEFKLSGINEQSVTVQWKTNIPTKAVINIQDRATGEGRTIEISDVKPTHTHDVRELKSETRYSLFIVAQSEEGETVRTDPKNFQTSPDSVPPEISGVRTKLTLSTGREDNVQAVITWTTDEIATAHVEYVEGAQIDGANVQKTPVLNDLTSSHVVVITKLRPATIYTFRVVSTDSAENRGASRQFKIFTPRKDESVLELIIRNFEDAFGFLKAL